MLFSWDSVLGNSSDWFWFIALNCPRCAVGFICLTFLTVCCILNVLKMFVKLLTIFFCDVPDIDECETGTHNCPPDFICQNTPGSFRCRPKLQCMNGFIQDALGNCIGKIYSYLSECLSAAYEINYTFIG